MKYGVINSSGEVVVELIYDKISEFSEGLAAVNLGGLWGFINTIGEIVIPLQFNFAGSFNEGLAKVTNNKELTGYINYLGEVVIPFQFYFGQNFYEGLAFVSHPIDGFIFINKRGEKLFSTGGFNFTHLFFFVSSIIVRLFNNLFTCDSVIIKIFLGLSDFKIFNSFILFFIINIYEERKKPKYVIEIGQKGYLIHTRVNPPTINKNDNLLNGELLKCELQYMLFGIC